MASVGDVLAALEKFELDLIEKQWSDDIWSTEFTSCPDDISEEFSDKFSPLSYCDIVQVIEQADKIINIWLTNYIDISASADGECSNSSSCNMGPSWTHLQDIDYKRLLSVLFFYICKGHLDNQDVTAVHTCVKATNFYFTLLIIPGSDIYKIFQFTLYEKCLETFSLHKFLEIATGRKIKKAKAPRKNDEFSSDDEFLEMDETLTLSQQQNVVKQLNCLLSTFQQFVNKFSFKKHPEALNISLSILAELSRIERSSNLHEFSTNNSDTSFAPLSRNAYLIMKDLCSPLHGRVSEIIRLVLFYLMPNLTSIGGLANPEINKLSQRELGNIRSIAVSYIIENIIPLGEDAHLGLKILVQQLCFNMIDRADYRSKATEMVLTIVSRLPMDLYYTILKWIFRLSMMEGAHHRVISLELLSRLIFMKQGTDEMSKLTETQFQHLDSQLHNSEHVTTMRSEIHQKTDHTTNLSQEPIVSFSQPVNYVPLEYRRVMFAIIIDRIRDEAAIVRTRALSILSDILSNRTSQALQVILRDIFVHPYADVSSINLKDIENENDFLKWKSFIALLDKVRDCEVSKNMIPGGRVIVNKVFEKCLDERVNVRKAALQVISSMFKFFSKWMTNESLTLFGKHCRDPAMSIRKDMLGSVTELMLVFPEHEPLVELWVEEVVPLIMDREIKVQEQALQIFTSTILSKITHFNRITNTSDELPWKLLNRIAKQNKKSFLMTACALWSESGSLNQSLITALKSHIGTVNDAPAWVFLSCISEYFDIERPDFVMEYYMDVVSKETGDINSCYLALYTLSTSWQKLPRDKKEILQIEMFTKLKSFGVNPTLVGLTVEIVAGITVLIAEEELAGKKEVAKWGIELIQSCENHLEGCLKASRENGGECKDCINILALLGALIGICPDKIKHPTFLMLFNYLMDTKGSNTPYERKMKAITVITLSKMALQSDLFARSLVAGLAQLLSQSSDPVVLNNVIVAIADIGESYANLIEPLIPFICVCLKSKHKSLKEITLILLIELLQEDYLKARGALVFHLLTMINEPNPWLVNIVKYYFTNSLLARNPYKMYQLLLPGLFHLNNYTNHPDYPRLEMTDAEWRAFDLSGPENHSLRMNIYQFMLSNIPDMVKMKCLHFICTVVLNGAADNIIAIKSKNGEQLLFDSLSILLTKEIKIEYNDLVKKKNEDGEEEDDQKQNPLYKLGKQMFTAAQKKEIIETIIPICCKLKKKLLVENKKLLPYLYKFVREIVKDYKDEINEVFKEDKQFGIEILHELEKISNNEVEEEEEEPEPEVAVVSDNSPTEGERPEVAIPDPEVRIEEIKETSPSGAALPVIPDHIPENGSEQVGTVRAQHPVESDSSSVAQNIDVRVRVQKLSPKQIESNLSPPHSQGETSQGPTVPSAGRPTPKHVPEHKQSNLDTPVCRKEVALPGKPNRERRGESKDTRIGVTNTSNVAPLRKLTVSLERLNADSLKDQSKSGESSAGHRTLTGSGKSKVGNETKRNQKEEENMEKAMHDIIMPPPVKTALKNKKYSLSSSKSFCNKTPTTPIVGGRKEPLTSTPLVTIDDADFAMDLSSVVDETS